MYGRGSGILAMDTQRKWERERKQEELERGMGYRYCPFQGNSTGK
jgi:hypothetical protein